MPESRVILVTGARKGIGRFLAEHYVAQGWRVEGCSREKVSDLPAAYVHHCVDVADEAGVLSMMDSIRQRHGRLDALVNNAGIASMNHCFLTPIATVERILRTNVAGSFLLIREAAKLMKLHRFGRIVNLGTVATPLRLEGEAVYAASKAAIESLTRTLAHELAPFGITINVVGPTPIETDLIRNVPKPKIDAIIQRLAIKRLGRLEDVANVVDFYLRPESEFITGQVLYLGGA